MTTVEGRPAAEIGQSRRRKEDAHLITGRTTWTDNMTLPGMLHLAMLRSPMAHAKITSIDASEAKTRPGVVAVFTGQDFKDVQGDVPCAWPVTPDMVNPGAPALAVSQVNFAGECVAVVAARSKAEAQDALEAIDIDYDHLPAVLDMEEAIKPGAQLVHPNTESNKSYTWVFDSGEAGTGGAIDEALAGAEVTVKRRFIQQRLVPAFMEPRSVVVQPSGDNITVWSATQIPHILRVMLALTLGIPEHKLRVVAPDVGGGFGGKIPVTPEEIIAVMVARRLGKPVKYTESRSESLMAAHHGRDQIQDITITATRDGRLTGLDVHLLADMGAYLRLVGPGVPILGAFMFNAIYKIPAYRFTCEGIFTTKTPTDAYRGAGRPEATYGIERIMDELAVELGMDPMELRRKNWIKHEEFPYTTVSGLTYDSGNYEAATDKALELIGWADLRAEQQKRRESNDSVQLGLGISTFTEMCGLAPSRVLGSLSYGAGGWEHAAIRMLPTGMVQVVTGASAHGQGHETAFAQIVADRLGVAFDDVDILHGETTPPPLGSPEGPGHLRFPFAGGRRHRDRQRRRQGDREGPQDRRAPARGERGRPGVRRREVQREGLTRLGGGHRRRGAGSVRRAQPARRCRAVARFRRDLRSAELLVPAWHPPVRGRRRHRDRTRHDPQVRVRRRRRYADQPTDHRGPGARRAGTGHRPGPVRGGGLRRLRQPDHRHIRRLHAAVGGRPAVVHHRAHRDAVHDQPARGEGRG
jgi:aerobic carbon-monoxide dehydrogenase large subunit